MRDTLDGWKLSGDMRKDPAALEDWTVASIQHMLVSDSSALAAHPNAIISRGGHSSFAATIKEVVDEIFGLSTVSAGRNSPGRRVHLKGKVAPHNQVYTILQVCLRDRHSCCPGHCITRC